MVFFKRKEIIKVKDSNDLQEKTIIRKLSTAMKIQVRVTPDTKFRIVPNPASYTVSFELCDYPGYVMRERGLKELLGEKRNGDKQSAPEISFVPMPNLWFDGYVSFESSRKSSYYIRLKDNQIFMDQYEKSRDFKEEASFVMTRKTSEGNLVRVHSWVDSITHKQEGEEESEEKKKIRFLMDSKDDRDGKQVKGITDKSTQAHNSTNLHSSVRVSLSTPSKGILKTCSQTQTFTKETESSAIDRMKSLEKATTGKNACNENSCHFDRRRDFFTSAVAYRKKASISERERLIQVSSDSNAGSVESKFLDEDLTVLSSSFTDLSVSEEEDDIQLLDFLDRQNENHSSKQREAYYLAETKRSVAKITKEENQQLMRNRSMPRTRKYGIAYPDFQFV